MSYILLPRKSRPKRPASGILGLDDEPVYNAGTQTLILNDGFDSYNTFADAVAGGWLGTNGATTVDTTSDPSGSQKIVTGNGGGKALRLEYFGVQNSGGQEAHSWGYTPSDVLLAKPGHTMYISYDYRVTGTGGVQVDDGSHQVYIKWIELWNAARDNRTQFSTGYQTRFNMPTLPTVAKGGGSFWGIVSGGNPDPNTFYQSRQIRAPFLYERQGLWTRITHEYRTNTVIGSRDCAIRMWHNGTLIAACHPSYANVIVPGHSAADPADTTTPRYWCNNEDLDAVFGNERCSHITLGSVQFTGEWAYTVDYDNFKVWRD